MVADRIFPIILACLLYCLPAGAQTSFAIQGAVSDSSGAALSKATVRVRSDKDSIQTLTGANGSFHILWPYQTFTLTVTMKGFTPYEHRCEIPDSSPVLTLHITLQPEYQDLAPVLVMQSIPVTIRGDTLQYHAAAFHLREGSYLQDLMPRLPGVSIQSDSGLMVMGRKVKKLLLDGKPFYGSEILPALKTLPYSIIDKVEVIDDYGDETRLTGIKTRQPEKVLNITIKKDRSVGTTGAIEGGGGNLGQYLGDINANLFKGPRKLTLMANANSTSFMGKDYIQQGEMDFANNYKNNSVTLNSTALNNTHIVDNSTILENYYTSGSLRQQQDNSSHSHSFTSHSEFEWLNQSPAGTTLRITGLVHSQSMDQLDLAHTFSSEKDSGFSKQTLTEILSRTNRTELRSENHLYYGQVIPHSGQRFNLDADVIYKQNKDQTSYDALSGIVYGNDSSLSRQLYKLSNKIKQWDVNGVFHYFFPLGQNGFLEARYGLHTILQRYYRQWEQPDSLPGGWLPVDSLSNNFTWSTLEHDLYAGYAWHNDKVNLNVGITLAPQRRFGYTMDKTVQLVHHYTNYLPYFLLTYKCNALSTFNLLWTSFLTLPQPAQLLPVTDLSNPQYPVTGNPLLSPELRQSISLNYEVNKVEAARYRGFSIGLAYSTIQNLIIPDQVHPHDTGTVIQHVYYSNTNGNNAIRAVTSLELPLRHWKIQLWGYAEEAQSTAMADSQKFTARVLTVNPKTTLQYFRADRLDLQYSVSYVYASTRYDSKAGNPLNTAMLTFNFDNTAYLFKVWRLNSTFLWRFSTVSGSTLQPSPAYLTAFLERSLLKHRQLSCRLTVNNLLDTRSFPDQISSANTITRYATYLAGRNFLFSVKWMFEKSRQKK